MRAHQSEITTSWLQITCIKYKQNRASTYILFRQSQHDTDFVRSTDEDQCWASVVIVLYETVRLQPHAHCVDHQQHRLIQAHMQKYKRTRWSSSTNRSTQSRYYIIMYLNSVWKWDRDLILHRSPITCVKFKQYKRTFLLSRTNITPIPYIHWTNEDQCSECKRGWDYDLELHHSIT